MLKTGTVPVSDQIQRVPAVPAGDSKPFPVACVGIYTRLIEDHSQGQDSRRCRGRRRRGAAQVAGGNGHVRSRSDLATRYSAASTTNDRTTPELSINGAWRRVGQAVDRRRLRFIQTENCVLGGNTLLLALAYGGWIITRDTRRMAYHCSECLIQVSTMYRAEPDCFAPVLARTSASWLTLRSVRDLCMMPCTNMA